MSTVSASPGKPSCTGVKGNRIMLGNISHNMRQRQQLTKWNIHQDIKITMDAKNLTYLDLYNTRNKMCRMLIMMHIREGVPN